MINTVIRIRNRDPKLPGQMYLDGKGGRVRDITKAYPLTQEQKHLFLENGSIDGRFVSLVEVEEIKVDKFY